MTERYAWRGGSEILLRHGAGSETTLLVLPALFEEANRMRRLTVGIMRRLAQHGIGTILPDLPGTGESLIDIGDVTAEDWRDAIASLTSETLGSIAIRGGALLDGGSPHRWRLAPETGERLLRDMTRATAFALGVRAEDIDRRARSEPTRLAGNMIGPPLYTALHAAVPACDGYTSAVEGPKLWRAAEPGDDPGFADRVAADILAWTARCGA